MTKVRVFLVDDHGVFRSGVRAELADYEQVAIVGDAGTVAHAVAGIRETSPDVVLLDVHMPDGGGLMVMRHVLAQGGVVPKFLALSVSDAAEDVIALIRAGARGYITKNISGQALADAIVQVHHGDAYFSPRLAGFVLDAFAGAAATAHTGGNSAKASGAKPGTKAETEPGTEPGAGAGASQSTDISGGHEANAALDDALTPRELEVLRLLARGYTYREIGEALFISIKTVETHASRILRKTQQSNRYQLTRWAVDNHLD